MILGLPEGVQATCPQWASRGNSWTAKRKENKGGGNSQLLTWLYHINHKLMHYQCFEILASSVTVVSTNIKLERMKRKIQVSTVYDNKK